MPRKPLPGKANSARRGRTARPPAPAASKAGLTARPRPPIIPGMDAYQAASLAASQMAAWAAVASAAAAATAAVGIWIFGLAMKRANDQRAAQAAEDRKVTQGMLAALQELIRRTAPPSSQAGPGPAE